MASDQFTGQSRHPIPNKVDQKENRLPFTSVFAKPRGMVVDNSVKMAKDVKDAPKLKEATNNNTFSLKNSKPQEKTKVKEDSAKKILEREQKRKDHEANQKAVREERRTNTDKLLLAKRADRPIRSREERPRLLAPPKHGITSQTGSMVAAASAERTGLASAALQRPNFTIRGGPFKKSAPELASHQPYRISKKPGKSNSKSNITFSSRGAARASNRLDQTTLPSRGAARASNRQGQTDFNDARKLMQKASEASNMLSTNVSKDGPRQRTAIATPLPPQDTFNNKPGQQIAEDNTSPRKVVFNDKPKSNKLSKPVADKDANRSTLSFNIANREEPAKKYFPKFIDQTTTRIVEEIEKKYLVMIPEKQRKRFLDLIFTTIVQTNTRKPIKVSKKRKVEDEQEGNNAKKLKVEDQEKDKEAIPEESTKEKGAREPVFDVAAATKASSELIAAIVARIGAPMPEFVPSIVINPDDDDEFADGSDEEGEREARKNNKEGTNDARRRKMTEHERVETSQKFKLLITKAKDLAEPLPDDKRNDHNDALNTIIAKWDKLMNPPPKDWYKLTPRCRHPMNRAENDIQLYIKDRPTKAATIKKKRGEDDAIFPIAEGGAPFASIWDEASVSRENTEEDVNPWRVTEEVVAFWKDNFRPLYRVMHTLSVCKFFGESGILAGIQIFPKGKYELRRKELKIQSNSNTGEKSTMISTSTHLLELEKYRSLSTSRKYTYSGCELDASVVVINPLARVEEGFSLINLGTQRKAYGLKENNEKYMNEWLCLNRINMSQIAAVWCYKCIEGSGQTVTEWNIKVAIPALVEHELARRRNRAALPHVTCKCGQAYH